MKLTEVKVPFENVNDPTAKVVCWKVARGAAVKEGDTLAELETTKATFPVPAPASGFVDYSWSEGDEVPVGETLCRITDEKTSAAAPATKSPAPAPAAITTAGPVISEKARVLMVEHGIDAAAFAGLSFVKEADVRKQIELRGKTSAPAKVESPNPEPAKPAPSVIDEPGEKVLLSRAKLYENRELLAADKAVLKSTLFHLCHAHGLQDACARQSPPVPRLAVILFEIVQLLKKFRQFNAAIIDDHGYVYQHINLGCAVDMDRGLKVVVIRKAETMSFPQLAEAFQELLVKYATDTLEVGDVTGTTFTVTDLAQEGVFTFDPLINVRTAAILGIGGEIGTPGNPLGFMLSCAFDHRLNSGKQTGEFLRELSERLVAQRDSMSGNVRDEILFCCRCFQPASELKALGAALMPSVEPQGYICSNCIGGY